MSNKPVIELKNISFAYHSSQWVLKDISLNLLEGETLGVVGPNGGGKSTLLKVLSGLLTPDMGEIFVFGKKVNHVRDLRQICSLVAQANQLNHHLPLTVLEFLEAEMLAHALGPASLETQVKELALNHLLKRQMRELSGGERQRVLIARALLKGPKLLILDEPGTGLDGQGQDTLLSIIQKLQTQGKHGLIIVDHNLGQVIKLSTKLICLNKNFHWHDHKQYLSKKVLGDIYHCEFEHLVLHELTGEMAPHHGCEEHGLEHGHEHKHPHYHYNHSHQDKK